MPLEVGDKVYLWCHAYLRVIGRVARILGQRHLDLADASIIYSDSRKLDRFLAEGINGSTGYAYVGEMPGVTYVAPMRYRHDLPTRIKGT